MAKIVWTRKQEKLQFTWNVILRYENLSLHSLGFEFLLNFLYGVMGRFVVFGGAKRAFFFFGAYGMQRGEKEACSCAALEEFIGIRKTVKKGLIIDFYQGLTSASKQEWYIL